MRFKNLLNEYFDYEDQYGDDAYGYVDDTYGYFDDFDNFLETYHKEHGVKPKKFNYKKYFTKDYIIKFVKNYYKGNVEMDEIEYIIETMSYDNLRVTLIDKYIARGNINYYFDNNYVVDITFDLAIELLGPETFLGNVVRACGHATCSNPCKQSKDYLVHFEDLKWGGEDFKPVRKFLIDDWFTARYLCNAISDNV